MYKAAVEEVGPDLYRAEVPLPRNPLKATNSYIIKSKPRNLVIDTGMNRVECKEALLSAFEVLGVEFSETDFFITHMHADHVGLVGELATPDSVIYFNRPDAAVLENENLWEMLCSLAGRYGFPEELLRKAVETHPGRLYSPGEPFEAVMVVDGDRIAYGTYDLTCLTTPGHTRGHTCLYDPGKKLLFSGDHILGDITPNISTWMDKINPLAEYFASLDRVYALPVEKVLPGHRKIFSNCHARIDELRVHHQKRLAEVMNILEDIEIASVFEIASRMTWDLVADSWEDFPLMQKWFASGEALSHIRYLEAEGKVSKKEINERIFFSLI